MARQGLLIGEVAQRSGASRKAVRLYEAAGILAAARRTASGYRLYDADRLALLIFVRQAQRLGFTLDEIKEIVVIKRSGRTPCWHVRDLVQRKARELDRKLADLVAIRAALRALLRGWRQARMARAAVCPCIEHAGRKNTGREPDGEEDVAVPVVRSLSRRHDRRR
jgi:MerR family transcriptional regulator, copper efflux regulator